MWSWIVITALLLLSPKLLRLWARYRTRQNLFRSPLYETTYSEAAPDTIPPGLRDALGAASAELISLGFEPLGFVKIQEPGYPVARTVAVLLHPGERTFATVHFAFAHRKGVVVDFEVLFADGWWLRTINRRSHLTLAPNDTGRVHDPDVTTLADQWRLHLEAAALETSRERREVDLDAYLRHRSAVQVDQATAAVRHGLARPVDDGRSFRITALGANLLWERLLEYNAHIAKAPPVTGVLAMRCPPDDLEIKYQNVRHAQRPHPRARWAFIASVAAFAVSALVFSHWAFLLWLIPFLLFHELGHWTAMRLFGHRDAHIRFIPFLGAATMSQTQFRKLSHEMIVLLAGPVPGMILGVALFQIADFAHRPYLIWTAITLIAINSVNLLPLHPLDGGRILHALVTAGRPRLDIALKAIAGALFLVGAIRMKDPTLAILAGLGVLFVRPGLRLARIDGEIRRRPGFGPGLSPEERRRFIFEALPEPAPTEGNGWVSVVQQIEIPLSHATPRLGPTLPWAIVYLACLGGMVAWGVNLFASVAKADYHCPPRSRAIAVACNTLPNANDIDWSRRDPDSLHRNPFKLRPRDDFPFAAFVWCEGAGAANVHRELREIRRANGFCPALPWETLPPETKAQREHARSTLAAISFGDYRAPREEVLAYIDQLASRRPPQWDPETVRLYKAALGAGPDSAPHHLLAERIGKSPSDSCTRFRVVDVVADHRRAASAGKDQEQEQKQENAEDGEDEQGDDEAGTDHADGTPAPHVESTPAPTRLSVLFASPADFAPLRRYLCEAGCQVDVLPYGSMDPRLGACF